MELNDRLDALTHKLLHKQGTVVPINAADIIAGTFGANTGNGNFVFPADLTAINIRVSQTLRVSAGIEIANASLTPYIDFHAEADVDAADFDWRFAREAGSFALYKSGYTGFDGNAVGRWYSDGSFHCKILGVGSDNTNNFGLWVDSASASGVVSTGAGAGYEFRERDATGNQWVLYATAAIARLWRGGYGDRFYFEPSRPYFRIGDTHYMGYAGAYGGSYAQFSHWNYRDDTNYGYMQSNVGMVFLSAPNEVHLRINNSDKWWLDNNAVNLANCRMVLNSNRIDTRGYGDDWHTHQWWSGNDGWRITEYGGLYFRVRDQDPALEILATGVSRFRRFDQIGAYDVSAIMTKSEGGGTGAKVGFWSAGQNAAQILKCWGSTIEGRTWDDGGWGIINADLNDMSTESGKSKIRKLAKAEKAKHKDKMKRLEPIHYVRKTDEDDRCVNCLATGKKRKPHGDEFLDEICPDCAGTKKKKLDKSQKKNAETGFFSFSAEEMAVEFPEAVHFDLDEAPVAIKPVSLIAILWEDNKNQQDQIDALEARLKVLEKK